MLILSFTITILKKCFASTKNNIKRKFINIWLYRLFISIARLRWGHKSFETFSGLRKY